MLIQKFDITIAEFFSLDDFDRSEAEKADLVTFCERQPKGIYHPVKMFWNADLQPDAPLSSFFRSPREWKDEKKSREILEKQGYTFEVIREPKVQQLKTFYDLYKKTTQQKERAFQFSPAKLVRQHRAAQDPVFLFQGSLNGQAMGGLLVFLVGDQLKVGFGAKEKVTGVRGGVGGVLERMLVELAQELEISKISHGTSANPVGVYTRAGLFEFKSRFGYTPYPAERWKTTFVCNSEKLWEKMIFLTIEQDQLVLRLLTDDEDVKPEKYATKLIPTVRLGSLSEYVKMSRATLGLDPLS